MPDDARIVPEQPLNPPGNRADRVPVIAFITDAASETALREGLAGLAIERLDVRRGGIRQAIAAMRRTPTPRVLVVDVTGEEQPLTALSDLADVVEPDVRMLIVGESRDVNFYRQLTHALGVVEYLYKPLGADMVSRHFGPAIEPGGTSATAVLGGRVVAITGARGGAGATTIAANLAWHFANNVHRHTVLLDPDIYTGTAAMVLGVTSGAGLRMALETPLRVDDLFIERAVQPMTDRLHVLSSEEQLGSTSELAEGAAERLLQALRRRYNFVVADVPRGQLPLYRDLFQMADGRVLVLPPTLAGVRDTLRLLALPGGPRQGRRALIVLNRAGAGGGLTRAQVEDALGLKIDVAISDLPGPLGAADKLGTPAVAKAGSFRAAVFELAGKIASVPAAETPAGKRGAGGWFARRMRRRT